MIIRYEADLLTTSFYYNEYPDHYVSESEKRGKKYIKKTMDYWSTIAFQQYNENDERFTKNYKLLKGIIEREDLLDYDEHDAQTRSFMDDLVRDQKLPQYVKHYPIMNQPVNAMIGELSSRPDNIRIKAYDDDSKTEEGIAKTKFLQEYTTALINQRNSEFLLAQGYEVDTDEYTQQLAALTGEQIQEYMTSYTSMAEKWANHVCSALKISLNMKEKSEDAFRDLLVTSREYFHIFENNSRLGLGCEVVNPKNIWFLTTPDQKYIKEAYASGTIEVMELSEIMEKFNLTEDEIKYLSDQAKGFYLEGIGARKSNLLNNKEGGESFTYDVYDPLVARYKLMTESRVFAEDQLNTYLGITQAGYSVYGSKFVVVQAYWKSKKKIGKLTYITDEGSVDVKFVDETYKPIPTQISIEWTWVNQWYKGTKIGPHVYINFEPLRVLDYSPIIGVVHEAKNTPAKSLVDLMKPLQSLYNVCMNQLFQRIRMDKGVVFAISLRYVPKPKDGDYADAIDLWMQEARENGVIFVDDSPENTKGAGSFGQSGRYDLSRHNEIKVRYDLAIALKQECWELVGFSRERLGSIAATQTATGTNAALQRSFTQTEPYFVAHHYVLTQVYQALVDSAQYIESSKPESTISYITNEGENAFITVTSSDIKLRDFHVYASGTAEEQRLFEEFRALAQPMLQNGATAYEIAQLYSTNSMRQMKDIFRRLKEKQEELQAQQSEIAQQQIEQQQSQFEAQIAHDDLVRREEMVNENYQKELDRINKKEIAIIQTFNLQKDNLSDRNSDGTPDLLQVSQLTTEETVANRAHTSELSKINIEREKLLHDRDIELQKIKIEKEKMKLEEKKMKNDLKIAQYKDKGTKNSPK